MYIAILTTSPQNMAGIPMLFSTHLHFNNGLVSVLHDIVLLWRVRRCGEVLDVVLIAECLELAGVILPPRSEWKVHDVVLLWGVRRCGEVLDVVLIAECLELAGVILPPRSKWKAGSLHFFSASAHALILQKRLKASSYLLKSATTSRKYLFLLGVAGVIGLHKSVCTSSSLSLTW
jgi:hypothetical protein